MTEPTHTLRHGARARLRVLEPPLAAADEDVQFWWRATRERWLRGDFTTWCRDRMFTARVDGRLAGSITLMQPRDPAAEVGAVEFVWTREDLRGNGIATFLLRQLVDTFQREGGLALFLCTTNPAAYSLYQAAGFESLIGDGMRCLAPAVRGGDGTGFDATYFAPRGPARVRAAHWGDLARFAALYNWPHHTCFIKERTRGVFHDYRFESHFNAMMQAHEEKKGLLLVLECPRQRLVGACFLEAGSSYYEQHTATVDFLVAAPYRDQAEELLRAAIARAQERGWRLLVSQRGDGDQDKEALLSRLGFTMAAEIPGYFRDGERERNLRLWSCPLSAPATGPVEPRPRSDYYGGFPRFLDPHR